MFATCHGWTIQQRLIRLQLLVKNMTGEGEEIARELLNTLSVEYGISLDSILAMIHDRVSSNGVAMRTLKSVYPNFWTWDDNQSHTTVLEGANCQPSADTVW